MLFLIRPPVTSCRVSLSKGGPGYYDDNIKFGGWAAPESWIICVVATGAILPFKLRERGGQKVG